jgi:hypothetical protein
MSIIKAVDRAYRVMCERKWDTVYWAIDLHGVCLKSNYEASSYEWINGDAFWGLRHISERPESKIILWSSVYNEEKKPIKDFFEMYEIKVAAFNSNPWEQKGTEVSCFDEKFYFSVLLDDKAGFDPETDWEKITEYLKGKK